MLCCLRGQGGNHQQAYNAQVADHNISSYPGLRRPHGYVATGGNALAAAPSPSLAPTASSLANTSNLVKVTVPEGASPGQVIHVVAPDGSGHMTAAQVPPGMKPGSVFHVQVPPAPSAKPMAVASPVSLSLAPGGFAQTALDRQPTTTTAFAHVLDQPVTSSELPAPPTYEYATSLNRPVPAAVPVPSSPSTYGFAHALDQPPPTAAAAAPRTSQQSTSTMHGFANALDEPLPPPIPTPKPYVPATPQKNVHSSSSVPPHYLHDASPLSESSASRPNQALLHVKVPPGVRAGQALRVRTPDGRLLTATVPPNVQEFHVSYNPVPATSAAAAAVRQTARGYGGGRTVASSDGGSNHPTQQQPYNRPNNNSGGFFLPLLGGAAMGAAGMATFDHFAHHGGDYGGGDYGGGDGGMDFGGGFDM